MGKRRGKHVGYSPYLPSSILELKLAMSQGEDSLKRGSQCYLCGLESSGRGNVDRAAILHSRRLPCQYIPPPVPCSMPTVTTTVYLASGTYQPQLPQPCRTGKEACLQCHVCTCVNQSHCSIRIRSIIDPQNLHHNTSNNPIWQPRSRCCQSA